jgi:hypothetical protein
MTRDSIKHFISIMYYIPAFLIFAVGASMAVVSADWPNRAPDVVVMRGDAALPATTDGISLVFAINETNCPVVIDVDHKKGSSSRSIDLICNGARENPYQRIVHPVFSWELGSERIATIILRDDPTAPFLSLIDDGGASRRADAVEG